MFRGLFDIVGFAIGNRGLACCETHMPVDHPFRMLLDLQDACRSACNGTMGLLLILCSLDAKTASALKLGPEYVPSAEGEEPLSCGEFDKSWHMLHFLLTGTAEATDHPLGLLYYAGFEPPEDFCSESIWIVSSAQVRAFRDALRMVSDEELRSRFDPEAMAAADVYAAYGLTTDDWDYVSQGIPDLRDFAEACADRGCGAVIAIA